MLITYATVAESKDPTRSRSIDYAGSVLIALTLAPIILALSKGGDWGWFSAATIISVLVGIASGFAFVAVERRVSVPMLDLQLLRNRILVGSTIAILIGAGTINGLMYLVSLYFQNPAALGFSPLEAGLGTLPATAGLVAVAPLVPRLAAKFGGRQVIAIGFLVTTVGFAAVGFVKADWRYGAFVLPLVAIAVGMGMSNGPSSSASTACVPANQVGSASGVSNMARYVGAAVATALAATIYGTVIANRTAEGHPASEALASGLAAAAWVMAVISFAGVLMAVLMGRHRAARGTLNDSAAAAAAHTHTLPTTATPSAEPEPAASA
jgi:Na+/melibiose symporter-like transporter